MNKGLWYSVGGLPLSESVEIRIEKDDQFTTTAVARDVQPKSSELAVVSMSGSRADYIAIAQRGRRIATGQITVVFSNLVPLDGLHIDSIRKGLPPKFQDKFDPPDVGWWRPTPRLWEEIQKSIAEARPDARNPTRDLRSILKGSRGFTGRVEGGFEVFERDAVASALQTWGGDSFRKRVLRSAVPSRSTPVAPFLSQLRGVTLREDPQIGNDHITFPGMEIARKDMVGSVVLGDRDGNEYLTILNCNRQPLEQTLGVDLIYYSHRFDSFVLVQYKRMMESRNGTPVYRPNSDPDHDKEIERMRAAECAMRELPRTKDTGTDAYRLSGRPFYMKLCEPKAKAALDAGMVSGMYIPLNLWRRQLRSPETRGPRGGVVMSWDTCIRRFNNSEFTRLLSRGWIGSAPGRSEYLSSIIESVLGSGRMLVLAATSASTASPDYRRDGMGRFAAEDDPSGAI